MANHDVTGIATGNLLRKNAWQGAAYQQFIHSETLLQGKAWEGEKRQGTRPEDIPQDVFLSQKGMEAVQQRYFQTVPSISPDVVDFASRGAKVVVAAGRRAFLDIKEKSPLEIKTYQTQFLPVVGRLLESVVAPTQLKLSQSGQELMRNVQLQDAHIRYATNYNYGVHGNIQEQKRVAEKIRQAGRYIEFDLEGIGSDITEFAFLDFAENGTDRPELKKAAYGLTGISDSRYGVYQDIVERYKKYGLAGNGKLGVKDSELYILRALAKRGHNKTTVSIVDGLNVLQSYASDQDVYVPRHEDVEKGLKLMNQDWHVIHDAGPQEYDGAKFGLNNSKVKLYAHDAKILDMLYHAKKNNIALSGLNVFEYDNKQIDNHFNGATGDARMVYRAITGGSLESAFDIMDTTMAHREMNSHEDFLKDPLFMDALARNNGETPNTSKGLQMRYGKGKNYSRMLGDLFAGMGYTQHGGVSDGTIQGFSFHDMLQSAFNPESDQYIFKGAELERAASVGDIFQIDKGVFSNSSSSGLSFTWDGITGGISFDGLRFDGTGQKHKTELAPQGLKGGSYAMLLGAKKFTPGDEVTDALGRTNGGSAAHKDLVALFFTPYGQSYYGDDNGQAKNICVWIGSEREAQEMLGNQKLIGSMPKSVVENLQGATTKDKILDMASGRYNDSVQLTGSDKSNAQTLRGDFKTSVDAANRIKQQDSASRWLREMTYDKANKSLKYIKYVHDEAVKMTQQALGLNAAYTITPIMMQEQASAILNQASVNADTRKTLFGFFGSRGHSPMSQTVANAVNSTGYLYTVQDVMEHAVNEAKKAAAPYYKTNRKEYKNVLNSYFQSIYQNTLASIAEQVNDLSPDYNFTAEEAMGQMHTPLPLNGKQARSFSVDVTNLVRQGKSVKKAGLTTPVRTVFTFDPDEMHWDKRLARTLGYDNSEVAVQAFADLISSDYGFTRELKNLGKTVKDGAYTPVQGMALVGKAVKKLRKNYSGFGAPEGTRFMDTLQGPAPVRIAQERGQLKSMIEKANSAAVVNQFEDKKTGAELSAQITEIMFRSTENISEAMLMQHGYTKSEALQILEDRRRRKGSTQRYLSSFLTNILDKNKFVTYSLDTESGALKLGNGQASVDMTKYLPYDRFDEKGGRFYTQLGGMQIATTKSFGPNGQLGGFSVNSVIDQMADRMEDFSQHVNTPRRNELERVELLNWMLGETAKEARMSGVTRFDQQDRRMGRALDLMPFFKRLGHYAANGAYDESKLKDKTVETLIKLGQMNRLEGFDTKNIKTDELEVLYKDLDALLAPLADKDSKLSQLVFDSSASEAEGDYFREKILPNINRQGIKNPQKGLVYLTGTDLTALGGFGEDNRHMSTVLTRAKELNVNALVRNNEVYDKIVGRGSMLYAEDNEADFNSVIRGQKVTVNTQTVDKILAQRIKDEETGKADKLVTSLNHRQALFQYANENATFMDPRLQAILSKNIVQRENTKDLMDMTLLQNAVTEDQLEQEAKRRIKTMEVVKISKDGVNFLYGGWDYVKAGDIIAWNESFEHTASKVPADREGYLTKRYFRDGREISAGEISTYLANDKYRKEIAQAIGRASGAEKDAIARQAVASILSREKFQLKYTIESPEYVGAQKVADAAEKSETSFPTAALGAEDERVKSVVGEGRGPVRPTAAVLEDKEKLNAFLKEHGYDEVTKETLSRGGFNNYNEFKKAALAEQDTYFNVIKNVFREAGFIGKGENPIAFGNTVKEAVKGSHSEIEQVQNMLATAYAAEKQKNIDQGQKPIDAAQNARKDLYNALKEKEIFRDKNGKNVLGGLEAGKEGIALNANELYDIDMGKLRNVVKQFGGQGEFRKGVAGYEDIGTVHVSQGSFRQLSDADEVGLYRHGNEKGIKVTRRMLQSLDQEEAGAAVLDKMRESYENLIKGHLKGAPDDKEFAELMVGRFNERYVDQGAKVSWSGKTLDMTYKPGERRIHAGEGGISQNLQKEIVLGDASSSVWSDGGLVRGAAVNGRFTGETMAEFEKFGISEGTVKNILAQYEADGHAVVGRENFLNTYSYISSRVSSKFNKIAQTGTDEEVQAAIGKLIDGGDFGHGVVALKDIHLDNKHGTNDPNNPMRRNMVVDFGLNGEHDYIALPYQNLSIMDQSKNQEGIVARNELTSAVKSAQFYAEKAISGNEEEQARALGQYQEALDVVREKVNALVHTKYGTGADATSGYLVGSGTFKAQTIRLTNEEFQVMDAEGVAHTVNPIMEKAKIDGISLGEHIKAGHKVNAVFLGRDFFENAIKDDGFQNIQKMLGQELGGDIFKSINDIGAVGSELRQPMEYNTSIGGAYLFYDETLGRNQARVTQWTLTGQNGDMDGDLVYAALARNDATLKFTNKDDEEKIVHARLNQLQAELLGRKSGVEVTWDDGGKTFRNYEKSAETIGTAALSGIDDKGLEGLSNIEEDIQKTFAARGEEVAGHVYNPGKLTLQERQNLHEQFEAKIVNSSGFGEALKSYNEDLAKNGKAQVTMKSMSHEDLAKVGTKYVESLGDNAGNEAEVIANEVNQRALDSEIAKTMGRERAGLINMHTHRMTGIMNMLKSKGMDNGIDEGDIEIVGNMLAHIKEAGQAPKNAAATIDEMANLGGAVEKFFGVRKKWDDNAQQYIYSNGKRNTQPLYDIIGSLYDSADGDIKEMRNLPNYVMKDGGKISKERILQAFEHIMDGNQSLDYRVFEAFSQGYSKRILDDDNYQPDAEDALHKLQTKAGAYADMLGFEEAKFKEIKTPLIEAGFQAAEAPQYSGQEESFIGQAVEDTAPNFRDDIRGTFRSMKSAFHGHGAMAMLGFAGATMMAGIMGGAPTSAQPTDMQAKGIQQENAMYEIPSTMPAGLGGNSGHQSYIININASTDRGRDFATAAINQAMQKVPQQGGGNTMTMNIKDSSSNIGYSDIANYISNML